MKPTKFWVISIAVLLVVSVAASLILPRIKTQAMNARVYQEGVLLYSIDLTAVTESYSLEVTGDFTNSIIVEPGRIRVIQADCPDQVCVLQGWLIAGFAPIVCLPNRLVIEWGGKSVIDTVAE